MSRKSYATEEIIKHLRTMEIERAKGKTVEEIARLCNDSYPGLEACILRHSIH